MKSKAQQMCPYSFIKIKSYEKFSSYFIDRNGVND